MKDIIDEVKEDLQNEEFSKIVKKYAKHVAIFIIGAILITSAFSYIKYRNQEQQEMYSKAFFAFYKNPQGNIPSKLEESNKNIYLDLAYLESSDLLKNKKKYREALDKLYQLSENTKYPEIRNLSKIKAAFIIMDNKMMDESKKMIKNSKIINSKEPFGAILNWSLAQLHLMNNDIESAQSILKTLDSDSYNIELLNSILQNSITTKLK